LEETLSSDSAEVTATLAVSRGGEHIRFIDSSKRFEGRSQEPVTDPGIWTRRSPSVEPVPWLGLAREDLYVILGGWTEDGKATFKVFVNPLVTWIWYGAAIMVVGALIAFWPDAREGSRVPVRRWLPVGEVETSRA
jgi:cytochrome c-type biogenesis protein CcmF